ncbi:hypothetical protein WJX77_006352 [Trebouxia sp. C0004]
MHNLSTHNGLASEDSAGQDAWQDNPANRLHRLLDVHTGQASAKTAFSPLNKTSCSTAPGSRPRTTLRNSSSGIGGPALKPACAAVRLRGFGAGTRH